MNGRNIAVVVIIILLTGAMILFLMFEVKKIDAGLSDRRSEEHTDALISELNQRDYRIYWIGSLPSELSGIEDHVTLIAPGEADGTNLPVVSGNTGFTEFDSDGNVINHTEQRDYSASMMIIINADEVLSETAFAAIRDCTVENHIPVLIIGKTNIDAFREYMILVHKEYNENSSMFFEITRYAEDDPIDPSAVSEGGHAYADAVITFITDTFDDPAVVYVTPSPVNETAQTEASESVTVTEETEDAA